MEVIINTTNENKCVTETHFGGNTWQSVFVPCNNGKKVKMVLSVNGQHTKNIFLQKETTSKTGVDVFVCTEITDLYKHFPKKTQSKAIGDYTALQNYVIEEVTYYVTYFKPTSIWVGIEEE